MQLDSEICRKVLTDEDAPAFACLTAAVHFLGEDVLIGDDGQPMDALELALALKDEAREEIPDPTVFRILSLLYAVSGDEYKGSLTDFVRISSGIADGDAFSDDDGVLDLEDVFWALYQCGLVVDGDFSEDFSKPIMDFLEWLVDTQAAEEGLPIEDFKDAEDFFDVAQLVRVKSLGMLLYDMGVSDEELASMDPALVPEDHELA